MVQLTKSGMSETRGVSEHAQKSSISDKQEPSSISDSLSNYEKINNLLKKNNSSLTIAEISRSLGVTRNTAAVSLAKLEGAKQVKIRRIGMAKLYSLKPEIQIKLELDKE